MTGSGASGGPCAAVAVALLLHGEDLQLAASKLAGVRSTVSTVSSGMASVPTRTFGVAAVSVATRPAARSSIARRRIDSASSMADGSVS